MTSLYVLVLVCSVHEPVCDTRTARAYSAYRAPEGFAICGPPGLMPIQNDALIPRAGEAQHMKCVLR